MDIYVRKYSSNQGQIEKGIIGEGTVNKKMYQELTCHPGDKSCLSWKMA